MAITVANVQLTNSFDYWRNRHNELAHAMSNFAVTTDSPPAVGNAQIIGTFTANTISVGNTATNVVITTSAVTAPTVVANSVVVNNSTFQSITVGNSTINTSILPNSINAISLRAGVITSTNNITIGNTSSNVYIMPSSITISTSTYGNSSIFLANTSANITLLPPTSAEATSDQHYLNANGSWTTIPGVYNPASNGASSAGAGINVVDSFSLSAYAGAEYIIHVRDNTANNQYFTKLLTTHNFGFSYITDYGGLTPNNSIGVFTSGISAGDNVLYFNSLSSNATIKFTRILI